MLLAIRVPGPRARSSLAAADLDAAANPGASDAGAASRTPTASHTRAPLAPDGPRAVALSAGARSRAAGRRRAWRRSWPSAGPPIVDRARNHRQAPTTSSMLDLARDATKEDANSSFFALVKKWHPDRLPPELFPVKDACARVFARMSEAHATLTDDEKRVHYMRLLDGGSGTPEMQDAVAKVVEAAADFQKAEVCFKRNDLRRPRHSVARRSRPTPRRPTTTRCSRGSSRSSPRIRAPDEGRRSPSRCSTRPSR